MRNFIALSSIQETRFQVLLWMLFFIFASSPEVLARDKSTEESYGMGLTVSVPANEQELLQAVQDVASEDTIQGTKEYNKDEYITGAEDVEATPVFPKWNGPGRAFYKIKKNALDPRNFKDSGDTGTLAVRYVVQHGDDKNTILKIDAMFVDDFHRREHPSNGSVESAEYKDIQDHLAAMHLKQLKAAEDLQKEQERLAAKELERKRQSQNLETILTQASDESLQQHIQKLRREAERVAGPSGANLRSAPFHSALSEKLLPAGTKVVILISTPYWSGVETEDGQHGWIHRSELELLP